MIVTIILRGGAVLRTHSMVVEDFNERPNAGREFSVLQWFTVVEGGMEDIRLINKRKGEGMWAMELRRWLRERMMGNKRKVRTIVEIVGDRSQL